MVAAHRLLIVVASLVAEHGLWEAMALVVAAGGLSRWGLWALEQGCRKCGMWA